MSQLFKQQSLQESPRPGILPEWIHSAQFSVQGKALEALNINPYIGRFRIVHAGFEVYEGSKILLKILSKDTQHSLEINCILTALKNGQSGEQEWTLTFLRVFKAHSPGFPDEAIHCDHYQKPVVWCQHPFYFTLRLHYQVTSFFQSGFELEFESPHSGIVHGTQILFTIVLPGVDAFELVGTVDAVSFDWQCAKNRCTILFQKNPERFIESVSRYLVLQNPKISSKTLEQFGYPLSGLGFVASLGMVSSAQEMQAVLQLRLAAHRNKAFSKIAAAANPAIMQDRFDEHSLILTWNVGAELVGTCRLLFNNRDMSKSEIAQFVELPAWLKEAGFVECSRMATIPNFQGHDIFSYLSQHTLRLAIQLGTPYILADCQEHLLAAYQKRGAKKLNCEFIHPLEGVKLHVIYYDVAEIQKIGLSQDLWSGPILKFLNERQYL